MSVPIPRSPAENARIEAMSPDEQLIEFSLLRYPYRMERFTFFISALNNVDVRKVYELSREKIWPMADTYNSILKGENNGLLNTDYLIRQKNDYLDYLEKEGKLSTNEMNAIRKSLDLTFPTGGFSKIRASVLGTVKGLLGDLTI